MLVGGPKSLKFKADILKKSDFSQADQPATYEFRDDKMIVPPMPNTPLYLKWGPVVNTEELVLDIDVCGKVKVVLILLISVTKNNNNLGPYLSLRRLPQKEILKLLRHWLPASNLPS